jgi:hypothetical protein
MMRRGPHSGPYAIDPITGKRTHNKHWKKDPTSHGTYKGDIRHPSERLGKVRRIPSARKTWHPSDPELKDWMDPERIKEYNREKELLPEKVKMAQRLKLQSNLTDRDKLKILGVDITVTQHKQIRLKDLYVQKYYHDHYNHERSLKQAFRIDKEIRDWKRESDDLEKEVLPAMIERFYKLQDKIKSGQK